MPSANAGRHKGRFTLYKFNLEAPNAHSSPCLNARRIPFNTVDRTLGAAGFDLRQCSR